MADSDIPVVCAPLCSAAKRRKRELEKVRLVTRAALKDQKGCWYHLKTVLKLKDSDVAEVLFDMLVHFLLLSPIVLASHQYTEPWLYAMAMLHVVPSRSSGLTPVQLFPECGFLCVIHS